MEVQPVANVARIAQMLTIPQDQAVALWRGVQEHLREEIATYAVAEAVKGYVQIKRMDLPNGEAKIEAQDVADFIIVERVRLRQEAEAQKRRAEYEARRQIIEVRQAKLKKSNKKSQKAVAKRINNLLTKSLNDAEKAIEQARITERTATASADAAEKRASAAEKRASEAETALNIERAALQTTKHANQALEQKIGIVEKKLASTDKKLATAEKKLATAEKKLATAEKKLATAEKALADEKASTAIKIAAIQNIAGPGLVPGKTNIAPSSTSAGPQRANAEQLRSMEIQQICQERGIEELFHFTHLTNLRSILTNGLLGRSFLERQRDSSQFRFNDPSRHDGQRGAVCLSIGFPTYKMFNKYSYRDRSAWAVVTLEPALLWELDCAFCRENAATHTMTGIPLEERKEAQALREMFMDYGSTQREILGIPDNYPTDPQAEVLVCEAIPIGYIKSLTFYDVPTGNQWVQTNSGEYLKQFKLFGSDDYFKPRLDWNWWSVTTLNLHARY